MVVRSPSTRREWIEISGDSENGRLCESPSTRREWIEMSFAISSACCSVVSLHTEGVD